MNTPSSRILDAVAALENGNRRLAGALIAEELKNGEISGDRWASVQRLATRIGEIDLAIEASRRFAFTEPVRLERFLGHCGALAEIGRAGQALELLDQLPDQLQGHPGVLHLRGTIASESGDAERAAKLLRQSLQAAPGSPHAWFALTMLKEFTRDDADFAAMVALESQVERFDPHTRARYQYALAKALIDMGEIDEGFARYAKGAAIRREVEAYDRDRQEAATDAVIREFTPEALAKLTPSRFEGQRSIFVTGMPRSGTTLVESILASHSGISDGAEVNYLQSALIPTGDQSLQGAIAYQRRSSSDDPWGEIADDYHRMVNMRFRPGGKVVDKTLSQSLLMGLLLHAMPDARVIWLRRRPEDVALSAYRAYFTSSVKWSWSLEDIAHQMRLEDRLHAHWQELFPERILTVPYEELVAEPANWSVRLLAHVGMEMEPQVLDFHQSRRSVRTASVQQVRSAISTDAVGKADRFADQMAPFRAAYYR